MGKKTVYPLYESNERNSIPIDVYILRTVDNGFKYGIEASLRAMPNEHYYQKLNERDAMKFMADVESERIEIKEWHGETRKIYVDAFAINI